jgi:hypothetical protein
VSLILNIADYAIDFDERTGRRAWWRIVGRLVKAVGWNWLSVPREGEGEGRDYCGCEGSDDVHACIIAAPPMPAMPTTSALL